MVSSSAEPEWDDEQQALVEAEETVARLTGRRGEWLPDATSDGADPNDYTSGFRFTATGPHMNWAEKTALDAEEAHRKSLGDNPNLNGVYFGVERLDY